MRQSMRVTAICAFVAISVAASAQSNAYTGYLDVYTVQVKPEKRAEFDAIAKKIADANRKEGDKWVAYESVYGEANTVVFVGSRRNMAETETAQAAFMGALNKAYGQAAVQKMMNDFSACVTSARGEIRVRRGDLSSNAPGDMAGVSKLVGSSRWLRTIRVLVRPGKGPQFEAMVKRVQDATAKSGSSNVSLVSQAIAGTTGTVYYVTSLQSTMGGYDSIPSLQKLLGEDYSDFEKTASETIINVQTTIYHFLPNLSAPTAEIATASPDFWNPKPVMAAKPKAASKEKTGQ